MKFERERAQPAIDLLNRIKDFSFNVIYDLGCGTGNLTRKLKETWPSAKVIGIDSSQNMLSKAENDNPSISWLQADLNSWIPDDTPDLLFSNATLHWLDNHEKLFSKLMGYLASGGILAVQMPNNYSNPTHMSILETIQSRDWGMDLQSGFRSQPVLPPSNYHKILTSLASEIDIWETSYLHVLEGENPVKEWTKGSVLRPFLEKLNGNLANEFEVDYAERILKVYPPEAGKTYMPFRRLFIVAKKK